MLSPTSADDLRRVLPSSVVRVVRLVLEKLSDVHSIIVVMALSPRIRPTRARSSRSGSDKVVFPERVSDVSGFELWSAGAPDGRGGRGM